MTLKERLFFVGEMCFGMASLMSLIGHLLTTGWSVITWHGFLHDWLITVLVAYLYNLLVASQITNFIIKLATRKITNSQLLAKRSASIQSWGLILIMCPSMSLFALLIAGIPLSLELVAITWIRSLILAIIIRAVIVRPLARKGLAAMKPYLTTTH